MVDYGVPSSIWLQNIVIGIIGTVLCSVILVMRKGKDSSFGKDKSFNNYTSYISASIFV